MKTLFAADDVMTLWAIIVIFSSLSIYLELKYKWAAKVSGAIIALIFALLLSNFKVIPTESVVYDQVWGFVIPLALPLLLFQIDIKAIWKESGRLLGIFLLSSVGTVAGTFVAFFLLKEHIPHLDKLSAMMSASYIGGGVNFAAMALKFNPPKDVISAAVVADNLMTALFILTLMAIPTVRFFRKKYSTPHIDEVEGKLIAGQEDYFSRKEISLLDIALNFGAAFYIVAVSFKLSAFMTNILPEAGGNILYEMFTGIVTDKYLILTTFTFALLLSFPKFFKQLNGSNEFGTFLIYLFFFVLGIPASIPLIIQTAPLLLLFVFIIAMLNLVISLIAGKLIGADLEEILLTSNANIGGPTTAAALAIAKGWHKLIGPILVVGTLGYIIGNYIGTAIGIFLEQYM
ncbi:DUF819 domain-containing protein [Macrococcoides caseolyticum]|uniref:DUF819 family protein n=1 Tax=Macrococcoides caseolyticum TaxID=69966 RepID=UPI000A290EC7|nr:DUF819 family protein [Macrococcus caseolyticus]ARQ04914.1 hypothetical protein CA207_16750 [Macrococcus caseolyticus]PKE06681.1 DUF819 domain-containing protein [Macrococcus caseolyticus]PKE23804.1 DUF819 domain-containing protein [Macrococcus caseolyticus]PKE53222.1 DUF819 domain-containing protein [Macrococcus caseolyticus]PKF38531.1 DUF819 domain-containing protein [Macrococcus caseolyticus]